jgi:tetratricopeptide (TPR) repeat protein
MNYWFSVQKFATVLVSSVLVMASVSSIPAFAADPFRTGATARTISTDVEKAFTAFLQKGNYIEGRQLLSKALASDPNEPLVYILGASTAYFDNDWAAVNRYSNQTLETAQRLLEKDPLRGNIYLALGNFLQAAYSISDAGGGPVAGAPQALIKIQQMLQFLDKAKAIDPKDPELNLVQGLTAWGLSSNLGLFKPEDAIQHFQSYAAPPYVSHRGVALVHRDQKRPEQALIAVDKALVAAPDNPELLYLKAQILRKLKNPEASLKFYEQALAKQQQLPEAVVKDITKERNKLQRASQPNQPQATPAPNPVVPDPNSATSAPSTAAPTPVAPPPTPIAPPSPAPAPQ